MEMLDRVEVAIAIAVGYFVIPGKPSPYRKAARAAIEAMSEEDLSAVLTLRKFQKQTTRDGQSECILWTGAIDRRDGYGRFYAGEGKTVGAHQFAYTNAHGPVPSGLVVDHVCRVRRCVNPLHLRVVQNSENVLSGAGITALNATKTHCKHGHELSGNNLYVRPDGLRGCKACRKVADRKRKALVRQSMINAALKDPNASSVAAE